MFAVGALEVAELVNDIGPRRLDHQCFRCFVCVCVCPLSEEDNEFNSCYISGLASGHHPYVPVGTSLNASARSVYWRSNIQPRYKLFLVQSRTLYAQNINQ